MNEQVNTKLDPEHICLLIRDAQKIIRALIMQENVFYDDVQDLSEAYLRLQKLFKIQYSKIDKVFKED